MTERMTIAELLKNVRDGNEIGWHSELEWMHQHHHDELQTLKTSIIEHGIREPIVIGNDGRVWDGHHRVCAAIELGLASVPVNRVPS